MVIFTKKFGTLDPHLPIVWDKVPKKTFFLHLPLWTKLYSDPGLQDFYDFYDMTEQCCSLRSSVTGRGASRQVSIRRHKLHRQADAARAAKDLLTELHITQKLIIRPKAW